jgi:D-serine deaminase-like pyridoxal phosphate-dependent protein
VENVGDVPSPTLLVYPDRVEENIRRMIRLAGGPDRLRPHIKTHKLAEIIRMQLNAGITRFKTATIAETEMVASCGAPDVLLAYQPVGPNVARLLELMRRYPNTRFSTIADDADLLRVLSGACTDAGLILSVLLDLDLGMHRTGVFPGGAATALYRLLSELPGLRPGGLHAYDGHIHDSDLATRAERCHKDFAPVSDLRAALLDRNLPVPTIVAGGTPTFPLHAQLQNVECSPGTCVLWDAGYGSKLPDLDFLHAAVVLTRVVSKPGSQRLCLDLGHKAIAAENPPPRVQLLGLEEARHVVHSEEHLVVETPAANDYALGDVIYGIPWHICPTVALHAEAVIVRKSHAVEHWDISARARKLVV